MAQLPTIQTTDFVVSNLQTRWSSILNPLIANPLNGIQVLKNIPLQVGVNVINHKLDKLMQGWVILDITGAATIYRSAPLNDITLTLTSNAVVTINLGVF